MWHPTHFVIQIKKNMLINKQSQFIFSKIQYLTLSLVEDISNGYIFRTKNILTIMCLSILLCKIFPIHLLVWGKWKKKYKGLKVYVRNPLNYRFSLIKQNTRFKVKVEFAWVYFFSQSNVESWVKNSNDM